MRVRIYRFPPDGSRWTAGRLWADVTQLSVFDVAERLNGSLAPRAQAGSDFTVITGREVAFNGTASIGMGGISDHT